jgi:hypothetical protein
MSNEIKNNLFRFVTLRNPQLIDDKKKPIGFIYHPDESGSKFFEAIKLVNETEKREALKLEATKFSEFKTKSEVRLVNNKLYQFSIWLMQNRNHLTFQSIKKNVEQVVALTKTQELTILDNIIYQTISKTSVYVREALIQLLIANQFLLAFQKFTANTSGDITLTEEQELEFKRRAHASVVIPMRLYGERNSQLTTEKKALSASQLSTIDNILDLVLAKERLASYQTLLEDLQKIEAAYDKNTKSAYEADLKAHNENVEKLIDETTPVMVDIKDANGNITQVKTYPDLKLPKFTFQKDSGVSEAYLIGKLSATSLKAFQALNSNTFNEFSEVYAAINTELINEQQFIISKSPKKDKLLNIGGAVLRASGEPVNFAFDYNIPSLMEITEEGLVMPFMMLLNGLQANDVASVSYTIAFNNNTSKSSSGFLTNPYNSTILKLFPEGVAFPTGTQTYTLSGTIILNNGERLGFDQLVDVKSRSNMGDFEVLGQESGDEPLPTNIQVYGVTNLGIADFRRVEQEVCCYVAGEVSHIENVMAREYKERTTRSLTSSETTSETSEERERENLTDTTTTERNEMQSEVASVINEDQSQAQGVNANVSYSPEMSGLTINTGAFFDSASSSSTSNSNSQAQTYAQEVTERAMERIVQKVQTKRTSRMLKEFEESNTHGFDNRKGANHVSGVYRWVDKIYKNKLINYGKRLMYEFAIPEPSKFLKEAIWKQLENNEVVSGIIKPEAPQHPSAIGVISAASITETNYQIMAAEYGAEVQHPPVFEKYIGKAFAYNGVAGGGNYNENTSEAVELDIPDGYYTTYASANWTDSGDSHINDSSVVVGNRKITLSGTGGIVDKFVGKIPVSTSQLGNLSGNVNVSIKLQRLSETLKQWQNDTYIAIMEAYNKRLQEYNDAQNQDVITSATSEKLSFNPLYNRSLEKKELKRIAIELITSPYNKVTSKDNYNTATMAKVKKDAAFQNHAATVKFFEQAFDWDIMAYVFYPYFYANENNWKDLFQSQDAADPLFQAFLQSGMARTIVPVRPGFEDAVNWYMATGEIWNGQGLVIDQDDDMYVSIAEEMQTVEGVVEGTWETRLPTNLTVIQAGSIGLNVEGLPCNLNCDHEELFDSDGNPIKQTNALIGGPDEEPTPEGSES